MALKNRYVRFMDLELVINLRHFLFLNNYYFKHFCFSLAGFQWNWIFSSKYVFLNFDILVATLRYNLFFFQLWLSLNLDISRTKLVENLFWSKWFDYVISSFRTSNSKIEKISFLLSVEQPMYLIISCLKRITDIVIEMPCLIFLCFSLVC